MKSTLLARLLGVLAVLCTTATYGQSWQWASQPATPSSTSGGQRIARDASGNIFVLGEFFGTGTFGGSSFTSSAGGNDVVLAKLNSSGVWQWARQISGTGSEQARGLAIDASGNVYVSGLAESGTVTFGTTSYTSAVSGDVLGFVAKYDANGTLQWSNSAMGAGSAQPNDLTIDANGAVVWAGHFTRTISFGSTSVTSLGSSDVFVAKLSASNGAYQWAVRAGGSGNESCRGVAADANGNIFVSGNFRGTSSVFGGLPAMASTGDGTQNDVFVARLNGAGTWQWVTKGGGTSPETGYDIATDGSGNAYVCGAFEGTATFGSSSFTNSNTAGLYDLFVAKIDAGGSWQWAKNAGTAAADDNATGIDVDASGNVYVTGYIGAATTFGSTTVGYAGSADVFAAKLNTSGAWQWALQAGTANYDYGTRIVTDGSGFAYIAGTYQGPIPAQAVSIAFGSTTLTSSASGTLFAAKMGLAAPTNANPVIAAQTFSIAENSVNNTVVGTVAASDPDAGQTLTYSLTAGNTGGAFSINSSTGQLRVANSAALDYETTTSFALTVQVADNGSPSKNASATITVNLTNVDDTAPAAPVVSAPANGSSTNDNTPTYSGTAEASSTVRVYVDGTSIGTTTASGAGNWSLTQTTALTGGSHTVYATATDAANNTSASSNTNTFMVDITAPTVTISSTASSPTSTSPIPVTVTFSESVTGFTSGDVTVTNGSLTGSSFGGSGTTYSFTVTPAGGGAVTVNISTGVAQDAAGNGNAAATQFSITYVVPTATVASITRSYPALVATPTVEFVVTFSGTVTGLTTTNFSLTTSGLSGASVASVSGSGATYTVVANTGSGAGTLRLDVTSASGISPSVTNVPFTSGPTYDVVKLFSSPTLTIQGMGSATPGSDVTAFVDVVQVLQNGTSTVVSGAVGNPSFETYGPLGNTTHGYNPTGATWTFNSLSGIALNGSGFTPPTAPNGSAVAFVQSAPSGNGQVQQALSVGSGTYQVNFRAGQRDYGTPRDQTLNVLINGAYVGSVKPALGSTYATFTSSAFTVDAVAPTAIISSTVGAAGSTTSTSPIPFTVTFSESVTGLVAGDVTVTNGTITGGSFSGSGTTYTFTVTPSTGGTVTVDLGAGVAQDAAGNTSTDASAFSLVYLPNLTVSTAASVAGGSYNNITVTGTGVATLAGAVNVAGTFTVQNGGTLNTNCQAIAGTGSFTVATGGTLGICDAAGIVGSGATGAVQVSGTRSFAADAVYSYNGSVAQATGAALPASVRTLTLNNAAGLALSQDLTVTQALTLTSGILTTGARKATLGSTATLTESATSYVTGTVEATRSLTNPTTNTFGGLGLTLQTASAGGASMPGSTTVRRVTGTALTGQGTSKSIKRYYDIVPTTNTNLNVTLTFAYLDAELNGIGESQLGLFRSTTGTGNTWQYVKASARNTSANTVTASGVEHFSVWTLGSQAAPLPVELLSFSAEPQGPDALLRWATASEKNNARFEVEASVDGKAFVKVGTVEGHGTSAQRHDYRFLDARLARYAANLVYYRLRQVDFDGQETVSEVRTLAAGEATGSEFAVYPTLRASGEALPYVLSGPMAANAEGAVLTVYSATGQRMAVQRLSASRTGAVALPKLPAGWYLVRLQLPGGQTLSARFGVQ
ncbi:hypothetical protein F0P96_11655 [Hymenobacter busanensis]|uniref:Uncharacterized protein n=1 Tax=Hymenobacter busanensis TaxID=2607656 RepID=A0A7L4ZVQ8_9BACT|nr:SBBP repeat-containing protein [Hymenobacter busanensis]KAA9332137.1 hypothetical protein F0P96_11655 [Hymenobacter busanensis]QHJ07524.1 hypothetical protein GUY19_09615 [Hymenobacter busanensis]